MVRKLIIGVVLAVALSAAAGNAYASQQKTPNEDLGQIPTSEEVPVGTVFLSPGGTVGLFCEVEKVDVCVMTQTEEDCTKLGGKKVDSCSMAEKADLLQNFLDSSDTVIYLKDEQGRFLMVNRRTAEMFKVSKEEVIGKTDYDFFTKEEADMFRANDRKVAETGTPMNFKSTVSLPSGQTTFIDHKFPVSVEGSPNAVGGIAIDITETE